MRYSLSLPPSLPHTQIDMQLSLVLAASSLTANWMENFSRTLLWVLLMDLPLSFTLKCLVNFRSYSFQQQAALGPLCLLRYQVFTGTSADFTRQKQKDWRQASIREREREKSCLLKKRGHLATTVGEGGRGNWHQILLNFISFIHLQHLCATANNIPITSQPLKVPCSRLQEGKRKRLNKHPTPSRWASA